MNISSLIKNTIGAFLVLAMAPLLAQENCIKAGCWDMVDCKNIGCPSGSHWSGGGEWLYWKVAEDELNIGSLFKATKVAPTSLSSSPSSSSPLSPSDVVLPNTTKVRGKDIIPKFTYNSGFRIRLAYDLPSKWVFEATYVWVPGDARTKFAIADAALNEQIILNSTDFPIFELLKGAPAQQFRAHWKINVSSVNLYAGRLLEFCPGMIFLPHFGFRANWNTQDYRYSGQLFPAPITKNQTFIDGDFHAHYAGYGVEGGLWGFWDLVPGIRLVGHLGGAILYSKIQIQQKLNLRTATVTGVQLADVEALETASPFTTTPMVDTFIGLLVNFPVGKMIFVGRVGWEQHVQIFSTRNLSGQGLTCGGFLIF